MKCLQKQAAGICEVPRGLWLVDGKGVYRPTVPKRRKGMCRRIDIEPRYSKETDAL